VFCFLSYRNVVKFNGRLQVMRLEERPAYDKHTMRINPYKSTRLWKLKLTEFNNIIYLSSYSRAGILAQVYLARVSSLGCSSLFIMWVSVIPFSWPPRCTQPFRAPFPSCPETVKHSSLSPDLYRIQWTWAPDPKTEFIQKKKSFNFFRKARMALQFVCLLRIV
jgi:hypothetical protein